ncbi:MAG TPA: hypothetical protein VI072_00735 [Polyangiaceae bacterium]
MTEGPATPEDAVEDEADAQTKRIQAAVPPRPVTLPPRPAGPASVRPNAAPLTRLSEGPSRDRHHNGQAVPQAPRVPGVPPPLPPLTGLASARPRVTPAQPPPLPQRPSAPPVPRPPSSNSTPPPPPVSASFAARAAEERAHALALQGQLNEAKQALTARDSELRDARGECARLRSELAERLAQHEVNEQRLLALAKTEAELRTRIAELERTSVELSSRLAESENGLGRAESRVQELEQELTTSRVRLVADAPALRAAESRAAPAELETPPPAASGPVQVSPQDNLKKIRGIGPKFERALKAAGLYTYAQIAALGDDGVRDLARALRISPDRIRREGWVERAQELKARANAARNSG